MSEEKIFILFCIIDLIIYAPYIWAILKGAVIPHAISWFIWFSTGALSFSIQIKAGGGLGSYITLQFGFLCLSIFLLSLKSIKKQTIIPKDWVTLGMCGISVIFFIASESLIISFLIIWSISMAGYLPTFFKNYTYPKQDSVLIYLYWVVKFGISYFMLEKVSLETALYPISTVTVSLSLFFMTLIRRRQLSIPIQVRS